MTEQLRPFTPDKTRQNVSFMRAVFGDKKVKKFLAYSLNNTDGDYEEWCDWIDRVASYVFSNPNATIEDVYEFHNSMVSRETQGR